MTMRCALYRGALTIFENPWVCPWLLFPKFGIGFFPIDTKNVHTKFDLSSFAHSWDNRGTQKKLSSTRIYPCSLFSKLFNGLLLRWTLWMNRPNLKTVWELVDWLFKDVVHNWDDRHPVMGILRSTALYTELGCQGKRWDRVKEDANIGNKWRMRLANPGLPGR